MMQEYETLKRLVTEAEEDVAKAIGGNAIAIHCDVTDHDSIHRAFDEAKDLATALEDIVLTGAHRILTSGGAADAQKGASALRTLIQQARNRIGILLGGGLHPGNIAEVARATGARELHTGLGGVIPYASQNIVAFESAVRDCIASLER